MPKFDDFAAFKLKNLGITKFMFRGAQVWPRNYVFTLIPTWTYNGSTVSSLPEIPASGGSLYATWTLVGTQNGTEVYRANVTPTTSSIGDSTNFSYNRSTGQWKANDRGTNGYSSNTSGPSAAQWNAPARSCTLNVSYSGTVTINGQSVEVNAAAEQVSITQAANTASYVTAYNTYDQFSIELNNYYDSDHQAPACAAETYVSSASCRCGNYILWSSNAHAYYYQTIGRSMFTFTSTSSWISISGRTITVSSRGKTTGNQRTATIKGQLNPSYYPEVSGYATATLYQKANSSSTIAATCSSLAIDSFKIGNTTVTKINDCKQSTVTIVLKATWREAGTKYTAYDDGDTSAITQGTLHSNVTVTADSALEVTGADGTTTSTFTVTNKHALSEKTWTVEATYLDKEASSSIKQIADSYTTTTTTTRTVSISVTNGSITAAGGSLTLSYAASHYDTTITKWNSDNVERSRTDGTAVNDTSRATISLSTSGPTGHADRFSRSGTTLTHTSMTNKEGTDKVTVTIAHPDDNTKTASTGEYSATNSKTYGTITLSASSESHSSATVAAYEDAVTFTASCPITWTSGYNDPGLSTSDFSFALQGTPCNNGYRDYTKSGNVITFGSLLKNTRSQGTTTVRASHSGAGNKDITITELKNAKGSGSSVDTPGQKTYGTSYREYDYSNYSLSISLSQYSSSSAAAPFGAATYNNILSCSAGGHKERTMSPWSQPHTIVTTYTWDSGETDVTTTNTTETGTDEGSWGNVSDTPTITPAQSWLTVSGGNVTVAKNEGSARSCVITAKVTRLDGGSNITRTVTFYQKKCVELSVDLSSLEFVANGGTATFVVTYKNTSFSISHVASVPGGTDPVYSLSSSSGGGSSSSGTKTITVTVKPNTAASTLMGVITVTPGDNAASPVEIDVAQDGMIAGSVTGFAGASWASNYSISYIWTLTNTGNTQKTISLTMYIYRTSSANDNPDTVGESVATISIGSKTVPPANGNVPGSVDGSGTRTSSRNANYTYWAKLTGTGVTSSWQQFEENE